MPRTTSAASPRSCSLVLSRSNSKAPPCLDETALGEIVDGDHANDRLPWLTTYPPMITRRWRSSSVAAMQVRRSRQALARHCHQRSDATAVAHQHSMLPHENIIHAMFLAGVPFIDKGQLKSVDCASQDEPQLIQTMEWPRTQPPSSGAATISPVRATLSRWTASCSSRTRPITGDVHLVPVPDSSRCLSLPA